MKRLLIFTFLVSILFYSCDPTPQDADERAKGEKEDIEQKTDEELGPDEDTDEGELKD